MSWRRSILAAALAALVAVTGLALTAGPASAAPAAAQATAAVQAPAAVQVTAYRAMYATTSPAVAAMQRVLGVTADGAWGPITDRAAWAFEAQVYMQWPNQASKVAAMQRAFNLDNYSPDIAADGAWGANTEYKFRGLRTRYFNR